MDSLDAVRQAFDRIQAIRKQHVDDFDLQILIADAQQEVIDRARQLRKGEPGFDDGLSVVARRRQQKLAAEDEDAAQIPADVPKIDKKSWQVAMGLTAVLTIGIFSLVFYLIQTARKINFAPEPGEAVTGPQKGGSAQTVPAAVPAVSATPTLRLYTDLIPGTVTIDDQPEQTLVDGELTLDNVKPGDHTVKVEGHSGSASFSFTLADDKQAPQVVDLPVSNNAMAVLVSVQNGKGHLVTDEAGASVLLDSKAVGDVSEGGVDLPDLGSSDHDLEVTQARDKQKFVLTYTAAPTLTVFVKSDPSTGMLTVVTGQDNVSVFINDVLYKRVTERGQLRIPIKVGAYRIRVHKDGFTDPPAARVEVKKAEEASIAFRLQVAAPLFATLQVKGAQAGTGVSLDGQPVATVGAEGTAMVANISAGVHQIDLHHDQEVTKQLTRTFENGATLTLSGADVALDRLAADNKTVIPANPGPPALPPPTVPQIAAPSNDVTTEAETVRKGGGFVPYHTPKTAGHYYFQAHTRLGGLLKHGKLQWYAGFQDKDNYVLFTVDGKHAEVREVRDGKSTEVGKIPFDVDTGEWVQVDVVLKADSIQARVKAGEKDWSSLSPVTSSGRDFTKDGVGLYIPSNDEVAVANFRFSRASGDRPN
jgi:hypothetical protein